MDLATVVPGMRALAFRTLFPALLIAGTAGLAQAQLTAVVQESGRITLSADGDGQNNGGGGTVDFDKPAGATVRGAYLAASSNFNRVINDGDISLNGVPISWDQSCFNDIVGIDDFFHNVFADVTAVVSATINGAPAGIGSIAYNEVGTGDIDGVAFGVIFDDPNVPLGQSNGVLIFFGCQALAGDTFFINLAEPLDLGNNPVADFGLGIGFGFQNQDAGGTGQVSLVDVNLTRMTSNAGGEDDGQPANGALVTVGGIGDTNANPPPFGTGDYRFDDELYDLLPFYVPNSTQFRIDTVNPSNDDDIYWATLVTSSPAVAQGIVLGPVNATNVVGDDHTVTATITDANGDPVVGVQVTFTVTSGPNFGDNGVDTTDANGQATFTYTGDGGLGTDTIVACFVDNMGVVQCSNEVFKTWVEHCLLVIGNEPGTSAFGVVDHTFKTYVDEVGHWQPTLLDNIGEVRVALPQLAWSQGPINQQGHRRIGRLFPAVVERLSAQILMWNPEFAPSAPELRSNAVDVWVLASGEVMVTPYGAPDRMHLWVDSWVEEGGIGGLRRAVIRFPFSIEGL
jgi:hypothetical protein